MTDIGESISAYFSKPGKPCGIKALEVKCSHGRKSCQGMLQIVADQSRTVSLGEDGIGIPEDREAEEKSYNKLSDKQGKKSKAKKDNGRQKQKKKYKDKEELGFKLEKEFAGEDEITVDAITWDGNGPKKVCCQDKDDAPGSSGWDSPVKKYKISAPVRPEPPIVKPAITDEGDLGIEIIPAEKGFLSLKELWPINAEPDRFYVYGRGCTETYKLVTVENYPNQKYSVELSLEFIDAFTQKINDSWEKFGKKCFNAGPWEMKLKLNSPKGFGKGEWGWKEDKKNWKAYFEVKISFGFKPLFGIEFGLEVSLLAVAGSAFGIPPGLSKLLGKCLADILIGVSASCNANLTGSPSARFYSDGDWSVQEELIFAVVGIFKLEAKGRIGSDYILSASLTIGGEVKLNNELKGELSGEGVFFQPKIELDPPFKGTMVVTTRAFKWFSKDKDLGTWTPFGKDPYPLYEGERVRLFPRGNDP